jgi:hypothetical protein
LSAQGLQTGDYIRFLVSGWDKNGDQGQHLRQFSLFIAQPVESPQIQDEVDHEYDQAEGDYALV